MKSVFEQAVQLEASAVPPRKSVRGEPGVQSDEFGFFMQFTGPDMRRRKLRLGKHANNPADEPEAKEHAAAFAKSVNKLCRLVREGRDVYDDVKLAAWAKRIDDATAEKLVEFGLIPPRKQIEAWTVGSLLQKFFDANGGGNTAPATVVNWGHTKRCLLEFFDAGTPIADVSEGDAADFEKFLRKGARKNRYVNAEVTDGLSRETVKKRIANAKQFFGYAVKHRMLTTNPFANLKSAAGANRERDYFVTREEATRVLEACPSNEWRLLFALSRFGGLRCPSEHLVLRWCDVDLPGGRMIVHSPKTKHHEGKESRVVPIFPELRPYLERAWDDIPPGPGAVYVITGYRDATTNLRTHLERIIGRAGLATWPKLWQNLRATRATELAEEFPDHVTESWLGHSTKIAKKHYRQVTADHFAKAVGTGAETGAVPTVQGESNAIISDEAHKKGPQRAALSLTDSISISNQWATQDSNYTRTAARFARQS